MADQLRQQSVVELPVSQYFNRIITQMQGFQLCVWVIFCFRQSHQVIGGYPVELCQRRDAEWADVLEIVRLIFAEGCTGNPRRLGKLFQCQTALYPQIFEPLWDRQFDIHIRAPFRSASHYSIDFYKRGNFRFSHPFSNLLDIREQTRFFVKLYLSGDDSTLKIT